MKKAYPVSLNRKYFLFLIFMISVFVNSSFASIDSIRICLNNSSHFTRNGDTITQPFTDCAIRLFAQGYNSETNQWVSINGDWITHSTGYLFKETTPSELTFILAPESIEHIVFVFVERQCSLTIITQAFDPMLRLELFEKTKQHNSLTQNLPDMIELQIGKPIELSALIFDRNAVILNKYKTAPWSDSIQWKIIPGIGDPKQLLTLNQYTGYTVTVTPRSPFTTTRLVATYNQITSDTVNIYIKPEYSPPQFCIETNTLENNFVACSKAITIPSLSLRSQITLYAIQRDPFGNIIALCNSFQYTISDTNVVQIIDTIRTRGQFILTAISSGTAIITICPRDNPTISATFTVDVNPSSSTNRFNNKQALILNYQNSQLFTLQGRRVKSSDELNSKKATFLSQNRYLEAKHDLFGAPMLGELAP